MSSVQYPRNLQHKILTFRSESIQGLLLLAPGLPSFLPCPSSHGPPSEAAASCSSNLSSVFSVCATSALYFSSSRTDGSVSFSNAEAFWRSSEAAVLINWQGEGKQGERRT